MENKKTTEILDLLGENSRDDYNDDVYEEGMEALRSRAPFFDILNPDWEEAIPKLIERIVELEEDVKKLKRHKHDEKNGDVLVRI